MAQKSKAAPLTGELLAAKGAAEPAAQSPQSGNGAAGPESEAASDGGASNGGTVPFPLRLDPSDHLELRMAAARSGRSCQELIVEALARYLADIAADAGESEPPRSGRAGMRFPVARATLRRAGRRGADQLRRRYGP